MTLTANGVDLSTLIHNVSTLTGRWATPPRRGRDIEVPARHGAVRTQRKKFSAGVVVLPMWVVGALSNGAMPIDNTSRTIVLNNVDKLTRIFGKDTVELVHTRSDGSVRRILGQVLEVIDFTSQAGATRATFSVALTTAGAFWEDVTTITASKTGTSGTWEVAEFAGATAPMDDLIVKFTGPCTNPRITNPSGVYVAYNAALTGSQTISIDCATWIPTGTGITASYAALAHGGDARFFVLEPADPNPQATVTQTAGSTGVFQLVGHRKYFVG